MHEETSLFSKILTGDGIAFFSVLFFPRNQTNLPKELRKRFVFQKMSIAILKLKLRSKDVPKHVCTFTHTLSVKSFSRTGGNAVLLMSTMCLRNVHKTIYYEINHIMLSLYV